MEKGKSKKYLSKCLEQRPVGSRVPARLVRADTEGRRYHEHLRVWDVGMRRWGVNEDLVSD
jgi:hypothetical protein